VEERRDDGDTTRLGKADRQQLPLSELPFDLLLSLTHAGERHQPNRSRKIPFRGSCQRLTFCTRPSTSGGGSGYETIEVLLDDRLPYSDRVFELWSSLGVGVREGSMQFMLQGPRTDHLLTFAAIHGLTNTIQCLLTSGRVPLSAVNDIRQPQPLIISAVLSGCIHTVECLVDLGADLDVGTGGYLSHTGSAIGAASHYGDIDILKLLINAGATVNPSLSPKLSCPLALASRSGHEAIVRHLLDAGADVNGEPRGDMPTPIGMAALGGHGQIVRMLLEAGADAKLDYAEGMPTPLCLAAAYGHIETARVLIAAGVDLNYRRGSLHHRTPLQSAVYGHHSLEMVQILLEAGADPNAWDRNYPDEGPPLAIANEKGYKDVARLLIHHGADLDVQLG
jgi:uncharacterized protein